MADIFVSYSAVDRERVRPIITAMQAQGWSVWWDRNIKPGPSFEREIEKALDAARCVVVLWSADSVESDWVRTEASEGQARKILVPVLLDNVDLPLSFRYLQTANLVDWHGERDDEDFCNFVDAVAEMLGQAVEVPPPKSILTPLAQTHAAEPAPVGVARLKRFWPLAPALLAVVLAIGYIAYDALQPSAQPWVAVLPFTPTGVAPEQVYLGDGLAAELINELSGRAGLRVASRTSSFYFKDKQLSLVDIASTLNASVLIEGDVYGTATGVQLDVRILDANTGIVRWARSLQQPTERLSELRVLLADSIAAELLGASAVARADTGHEAISGDAYQHYLKGYEALRRPHTEKAIAEATAEFGSAIALQADFAGAHAGLCETYLADYTSTREPELFDAASTSCNFALQTSAKGDDWRVHVALGNLYVVAGTAKRGVDELRKAAALRPNSPEIQRSLAAAYEALGDPERAETLLRAAIELEPTYWDAYVFLASVQYRQRRYRESVATLTKVLRMVPKWPGAIVGLGSAYYMSGDRERAAAIWREAEQLGAAVPVDNLAGSYSNLGLERYYAGDFTEAVKLHEKAAHLLPHDHRFWGRIAESYRGAGDAAAERANYEKAVPLALATLRSEPNDWETLGLVALYYAFLGQAAESAKYIERTAALAADNPTAQYFLSLAYAALDDEEAMFAHLQQALARGFSPTLIAEDRDLLQMRDRYPERFAQLMESR